MFPFASSVATGPWSPLSPFAPGVPGAPSAPFRPGSPCGPVAPFSALRADGAIFVSVTAFFLICFEPTLFAGSFTAATAPPVRARNRASSAMGVDGRMAVTSHEMPTKEQINEALKAVIDPELHADIVTLGMVRAIDIQDSGRVDVVVS